ncbi:signal transduction histidine kinase [Cellulosimicrobium cellulans]|uniref:sensor histidine kinase n=1 Tax=Cellulosimicrobium cellulans TaxID=1710 RepID=UPI0019592F22|nr:histidine kinase [Cellulosimicrobium cellulans]MBM7817662.1 signal transduction histidine kinase [Cellulosimicrobium cellulans]
MTPDDARPTRAATAPGPGGWGRVVAPLRSATTVRAGVYLVVGGVVAGAYVTLVAGFVQMFASLQTPRVAILVLALVSAVLVSTPPFLATVRSLEIAAARTFLDVDVPLPAPGAPAPGAATRWRAAAWYGLHLTLGAAVLVVVLFLVPVATQLVLSATGVEPVLLTDWRPWEALPAWTWLVTAVLALLAVPYVVALARAMLRQAALPLLGPDQTERIAELEAAADRDAERGRLARELHDSVGHALTVTTLQAAAAARLLDRDPVAARAALAAIEETGRTAMADLDHVLGLLRADGASATGGAPPAPVRSPARTLDDLDALLDDARRTGADVRRTGGDARVDVPRAVSQEAYRVVQEALTNALRHAPGEPVAVGVASGPGGALVVEVRNPLVPGTRRRAPDAPGRERRGLAGMRERAHLLRGDVSAGPAPDGGAWVVRATFPLAGSGG